MYLPFSRIVHYDPLSHIDQICVFYMEKEEEMERISVTGWLTDSGDAWRTSSRTRIGAYLIPCFTWTKLTYFSVEAPLPFKRQPFGLHVWSQKNTVGNFTQVTKLFCGDFARSKWGEVEVVLGLNVLDLIKMRPQVLCPVVCGNNHLFRLSSKKLCQINNCWLVYYPYQIVQGVDSCSFELLL